MEFDHAPLSWISPFLISLLEAGEVANGELSRDTGFGEALSQIMSFCLQDMQHGRFAPELRADMAQTGFNVSDSLLQAKF